MLQARSTATILRPVAAVGSPRGAQNSLSPRRPPATEESTSTCSYAVVTRPKSGHCLSTAAVAIQSAASRSAFPAFSARAAAKCSRAVRGSPRLVCSSPKAWRTVAIATLTGLRTNSSSAMACAALSRRSASSGSPSAKVRMAPSTMATIRSWSRTGAASSCSRCSRAQCSAPASSPLRRAAAASLRYRPSFGAVPVTWSKAVHRSLPARDRSPWSTWSHCSAARSRSYASV